MQTISPSRSFAARSFAANASIAIIERVMMHDLGDTIRTATLYNTLDVRVDRVTLPNHLRPDEVLVQVSHAGICGSELHAIEGYEIVAGNKPSTPSQLGHEYAGIVTRIGAAVTGVRVGQRVTALPRGNCGRCELCRNGMAALCRKVVPRGGAWADAIILPESMLYGLPDDVPLNIGALTEPMSCALRIVDRAGVRPGVNVCVIGAGPIGLFSAVLAKHAGAAKVIVSEPRASRRESASRMGIDIVVNPKETDLVEVVRQHTNGRGVECSIESVGLEPALSQAIQVVAIGGTVLWGGVAPTSVSVPISPNDMFMREYTLRTSWGGILEYERTIRMLQAIDWSPLAHEIFSLDDVMTAVNYSRKEAAGKVLLSMQ